MSMVVVVDVIVDVCRSINNRILMVVVDVCGSMNNRILDGCRYCCCR